MEKNPPGGLADVWPPGFRFHPTDEELVLYWLKRKIRRRKLKLDIVGDVDVYKHEPEELPGLSLLKTGDRQWFFFSPRDRKYPHGLRSNRTTKHGYWKTTGKDRSISCNARTVGLKKTLVFYKGRAPNGERTDWVMHEYTLDEDELNRCQDAQEYYALYKVYKKSGPGPKNGEQYGAPFREEDWAEDEPLEVSNSNAPTIHMSQSDGVADVDNCRDKLQVECAWSDIEEFMKKLADVPLPEDTVHYQCAGDLPQVFAEEVASSSISDPSVERALYVGPQTTCPPFPQQNTEGYTYTISTGSQLSSSYATEMPTSANEINLILHVAEDDFLEMDDLLGLEAVDNMAELVDPQPSNGIISAPQSSSAQIPENGQWRELDGLSELDLYHVEEMDFPDIGLINEAAAANHSCEDAQEELVNPVSFEDGPPSRNVNNYLGAQLETYDNDGFVPAASKQILDPVLLSNPDYDNGGFAPAASKQILDPMLLSNSGGVCDGGIFTPNNAMESYINKNGSGKGVDGGILTPNNAMESHQNKNGSGRGVDGGIFTPNNNAMESYQNENGSGRGVVDGGIFTPNNNAMESYQNENGSGKGDEVAENWFSSALWSFVESIPTTPASATESSLVNGAFKRMSSFSRLSMRNAKSTTIAPSASDATSSTATPSSRGGSGDVSSAGVGKEDTGGRMKGILILSFVVALFAVFFVLLSPRSKVILPREREYIS